MWSRRQALARVASARAFLRLAALVRRRRKRGLQVARVFVGALDGPPRSLPALAASVARKGRTGIVENDIAAALAAAAPHIEPLRRRMHAACIGRAVKEALQ